MSPEYLNAYFKINEQQANELPSEFIIVTAFNPEGRDYSPKSNQKFDSDLGALIRKKALNAWRVIGGSRDFIHAEPGYAVQTNLKSGIEIGVKFHQEAIFWVTQNKLFLVDCDAHQAVPMGDWNSPRQGGV